MNAVYYLVLRNMDLARSYSSAADVAVHLLGRNVSNYIFIKSDEKGDRVVTVSSNDITEIQKILENA